MGTTIRIKSFTVVDAFYGGIGGSQERLKVIIDLEPETSAEWRQLFVDQFNQLRGDDLRAPVLTDNIGSFFTIDSKTIAFLVITEQDELRHFVEELLLPALTYANQRAAAAEQRNRQEHLDSLVAELERFDQNRDRLGPIVEQAKSVIAESLGVEATDADQTTVDIGDIR